MDLGMKLLPYLFLSPCGEIPYETNNPLYTKEILKDLLTVGREVHVC